MKQSVSPAAMAAVIVVVVALACFVGWKMFMGGPAQGGPKPAAVSDGSKFREQYQNYGQNRPRMPGNMGNPGAPGPSGR